jgi:hypothetical protein
VSLGTGGGTRLPRLTSTRLAWLLATRRPAWALALWLCLAAVLAVPALLPLIGAMAVDGGLAASLARSGQVTVQRQVASAADLDGLEAAADHRLEAVGGGVLVPLGAVVSSGPLHLVSVNGIPAPSRLASRTVSAAYVENLAAAVTITAGELPPEGLGGGGTAVTLSQAQADRLGLHLSDRFCLAQAPGGPAWCGRLVGLWQPLDGGSPYWVGSLGPLLAMGRYDLFQLVAAGLLHDPVATVRYWADPTRVSPGAVPELSRQLATLPGRIDRARLATDLGAALLAFQAQERPLTSTVLALDTALTLLALCVAGLVGARFLDGLGPRLNLLRARGWSRWRTGRLAFFGLGLLLAGAVPAGIAACGLGTAVVGLTGDFAPLSLASQDLGGDVAALAIEVAALLALQVWLAARAVWRVGERLREPPAPWWRRPAAAAVLAPLGILALLVPHVLGRLPRVPLSLQADLPAVPALGMALLAGALCLRPLAAWMPRRTSVAGALAGWQIERRPEQHASAALCLVLAAAIAVSAALGLAATLASDLLAREPVLRRGLAASLAVTLTGTAILVLGGFGLHFLAAAGRRLREYAGLFAHGLPAAQAARSLRAEQLVTARSSLLLGGLLGLALALVALPLPAPTVRGTELGTLSVLAVAGLLLAAELAVGRLVRDLPGPQLPYREDGPG